MTNPYSYPFSRPLQEPSKEPLAIPVSIITQGNHEIPGQETGFIAAVEDAVASSRVVRGVEATDTWWLEVGILTRNPSYGQDAVAVVTMTVVTRDRTRQVFIGSHTWYLLPGDDGYGTGVQAGGYVLAFGWQLYQLTQKIKNTDETPP